MSENFDMDYWNASDNCRREQGKSSDNSVQPQAVNPTYTSLRKSKVSENRYTRPSIGSSHNLAEITSSQNKMITPATGYRSTSCKLTTAVIVLSVALCILLAVTIWSAATLKRDFEQLQAELGGVRSEVLQMKSDLEQEQIELSELNSKFASFCEQCASRYPYRQRYCTFCTCELKMHSVPPTPSIPYLPSSLPIAPSPP